MSTMIPPTTNIVAGPGAGRDEPMTEVQAVKLRELTQQLGEPFDAVLTRRQAASRIRALEKKLR
jgi:hypothetical protein